MIVQQTAEKHLWYCSVWSDHSCSSQHVALNSEGTPGMSLITPQPSSDKTLPRFELLNTGCCISIAVWAEQVFAKRNGANPTKEIYPRVKEKKKKKKRLLSTWNYCSDARREQCISQNLHGTNHQSSTSQSTGFPTASRRNKNTPRHTLLSYSITCSAVPKLTSYTNCCST